MFREPLHYKMLRDIDRVYDDTNETKNVVDIRKYFDFEWDEFYLFGEYATPEDISHEIGLTYKGNSVEDLNVKAIFIKNNKVVFEESFKRGMNKYLYIDYSTYTKHSSSIFKVIRTIDTNGYYRNQKLYLLKQ